MEFKHGYGNIEIIRTEIMLTEKEWLRHVRVPGRSVPGRSVPGLSDAGYFSFF